MRLSILHRGAIVYERYFGVMKPHTPHIAFSVTKSFVATIAQTLVARGRARRARDRSDLRAGVAQQRLRRCDDPATARHDDGDALHRGLHGRQLLGVAVQPRRRLPSAAGGISGTGVVLRLHRTAAQRIGARPAFRLQDGQHRHARMDHEPRDWAQRERSADRAAVVAAGRRARCVFHGGFDRASSSRAEDST